MPTRWLVAGLLMLAACATAVTQAAPGQDVELVSGIPVQLAGTEATVTMIEVANDSRCPADVVCVTAGNAEVRLRVRDGGQDSVVSLNTMQEPRAVTVGAIRLELTGLRPETRTGAPISQADYRALFRWSRP